MPYAAPAMVSTELSGALLAVGAVFGIEVATTEQNEWQLDERGLRVGLGWYLQRGHGANEAVALAALQLWEGPLDAVRAPARALRSRALVQSRPLLQPLIGAVRRALAMGELLSFMPGLRLPLHAAVNRSLPEDFTMLPRHLQFSALVLLQQVTPAASHALEVTANVVRVDISKGIEDPTVTGEWQLLRGSGSGSGSGTIDALQYVLAPHSEVPALRRFERALALLLPAYERLLALDLAEHRATMLGGSDRAELSVQSDEQLNSEDFASGDISGEETSGGENQADENQPDAQPNEQPGGAPNPADLFAAERESFAATMLSTPIPDASALFDAAIRLAEAPTEDRSQLSDTGAGGPEGSAAATILAEYRSKTEQLAGPIDAMRALWARVIAERIAPRRSRSRRAQPEGDALATEQFATIVADVRAGVRRPHAFLREETRPRRTRSVGSTDYVLVVDRSASMLGSAAEAAADAALIMVEGLAAAARDIEHAERAAGIDFGLDIRTSLIVFDAEAVVLKPLSCGLDDHARRRMHGEVRTPSGATNDAAALKAAGEQLGVGGTQARTADGVQRQRIVMLVSDGGSNDPIAAALELQRLRTAGVSVHGIGVGSEDLALRYAPNGVSIKDPRSLPGAIERVLEGELG